MTESSPNVLAMDISSHVRTPELVLGKKVYFTMGERMRPITRKYALKFRFEDVSIDGPSAGPSFNGLKIGVRNNYPK